MQSKIFREVSLKRLSSPDQLDQQMKVTHPMGWLALFALGTIILFAIFWGFMGSIESTVSGKGILIKTGGVFDISPHSPGRITDVYVSTDDIVQKGAIVARVSQPELVEQIKKKKEELLELEEQRFQISSFNAKDLELQLLNINKQGITIQNAINNAEDQINLKRELFEKNNENLKISKKNSQDSAKRLQEKIESEKRLLAKGVISKQKTQNTIEEFKNVLLRIEELKSELKQASVKLEREIDVTEEKIANYKNELEKNNIKKNQLKNSTEEKDYSGQIQLNELRRQIELLQNDLEYKTRIHSPFTGKILSVGVDKGELVNQGESIFTLERTGKDIGLKVAAFVPAALGKSIQTGMLAQISPSTVKKEEYGAIVGVVTDVSSFPVTPKQAQRILHNDSLVQTLTREGNPIAVTAEMVPDPETFSGFKWTSPKGPPNPIVSGTICEITITVKKQIPISLVIPLLKKFFGVQG